MHVYRKIHSMTSPSTATVLIPDKSSNITSLFDLNEVAYSYAGGHSALRNITLRIHPAEKVAILGANGCGKSTLLRLMDGLVFASSGRFSAFGSDITADYLNNEQNSFQFRRRVGYIFQNSEAQLFSSTVREELAFGPMMLGLSRSEVDQRIDDMAKLLHIERLLDRAPFHLSGGEKKKVAIGSSLVVNPEVLLFDEPTNGLDPRSQRWLVELIMMLHSAGKTIITATHDLSIVPEISDRAIVFGEDHGIAAEGHSRDILANLDLLLRVNLIHEHAHRHGSQVHSHAHYHDNAHEHTHNQG